MPKNNPLRVEVFPDTHGKYRFRFRSRNGEIVAQSEGYVHKGNATRAAQRLCELICGPGWIITYPKRR